MDWRRVCLVFRSRVKCLEEAAVQPHRSEPPSLLLVPLEPMNHKAPTGMQYVSDPYNTSPKHHTPKFPLGTVRRLSNERRIREPKGPTGPIIVRSINGRFQLRPLHTDPHFSCVPNTKDVEIKVLNCLGDLVLFFHDFVFLGLPAPLLCLHSWVFIRLVSFWGGRSPKSSLAALVC